MNPVVVTFADDKMLPLAIEQARNFISFGLEHVIIRIPDASYSTELWLDLLDRTIDAVKRFGKIMRVDAEVRIHKPLPQAWYDNDNVLFEPYPISKTPFYVAANTGQIILGQSSLHFLEILRKCIVAMIPPDGDTSLPTSGAGHVIEDEWPIGIAIAVSGLQYHKEQLCHDRRLQANCAANRGLWLEENTILTHPSLHNWNWPGSGLTGSAHQNIKANTFVNHFAPDWPLHVVELILQLLLTRNSSKELWEHFAEKVSAIAWRAADWDLYPMTGKVRYSGVGSEGNNFKYLTPD